jgi:hypothetical protein
VGDEEKHTRRERARHKGGGGVEGNMYVYVYMCVCVCRFVTGKSVSKKWEKESAVDFMSGQVRKKKQK